MSDFDYTLLFLPLEYQFNQETYLQLCHKWVDSVSLLYTLGVIYFQVFSAATFAYLAGMLSVIGSTIAGTATSTALVTATSTALVTMGAHSLPLLYSLTSNFAALTLIPAFPAKVSLDSRPLVDLYEQEHLVLGNESQRDSKKEEGVDNKERLKNDLDLFDTLTSRNAQDKPSVNKESHGLLNSFLPHFLALLTLKDNVLEFAFGAKHENKTYKRRQTPTTNPKALDNDEYTEEDDEGMDPRLDLEDMSNFCSSGPCLMDSWPGCFNVTTENDWTEFKAFSSRCCANRLACCQQCVINGNPTGRLGELDYGYYTHGATNVGHGYAYKTLNSDQDLNSGPTDSVKCCCRFAHLERSSWLRGSLEPRVFDLNLRFATQTFFQQALITT